MHNISHYVQEGLIHLNNYRNAKRITALHTFIESFRQHDNEALIESIQLGVTTLIESLRGEYIRSQYGGGYPNYVDGTKLLNARTFERVLQVAYGTFCNYADKWSSDMDSADAMMTYLVTNFKDWYDKNPFDVSIIHTPQSAINYYLDYVDEYISGLLGRKNFLTPYKVPTP